MRIDLYDGCGYVRFVESWGRGDAGEPEAAIIEAARQSTQGSFRGWEHDEKLLRYLYEHKHSTPFEFAGMTIEVQAPIFVFREWHRHRTQCAHPDTLVHFDAPKSRDNRRYVYKMRIEDIWKKWQPTVRTSRPERQVNALFPRSRIQAMQLRNLDEEAREFGHSSIVDVIRGEPKEMVRVSTSSGRSVALSLDHRVLTNVGWMRLGEALKQGVLLTLEGTTRAHAQRWERPLVDESREDWRFVVGWEGLYEVSSEGRVRRVGCAPKSGTVGPGGYAVVSLSCDGRTVARFVHSLVLEAFRGLKRDGMEARHLNHNRADARLQNLEWGTAKENARDRVEADRNQRLVPVFEEIAEVQKLGMVPTYDLAVEGPWHNFVADGFVVHNSYNEMSARYEPLPNVNYVPSVERLMINAGGTNKQAGTVKGSNPLVEPAAKLFQYRLEEAQRIAQIDYEWALDVGVPKELARCFLPVSRCSRMRASANLRNWLAFLTLRMDPAAQWEIRQAANAVGTIIEREFPRTWKLFVEAR
jgi:flavin-dependent thymidylate synthase